MTDITVIIRSADAVPRTFEWTIPARRVAALRRLGHRRDVDKRWRLAEGIRVQVLGVKYAHVVADAGDEASVLRTMRRVFRYSQDQVAAETGINRAYVSLAESRRRRFRPELREWCRRNLQAAITVAYDRGLFAERDFLESLRIERTAEERLGRVSPEE